MNKKGQGLSITAIVVIMLAILAFGILAYILITNTNFLSGEKGLAGARKSVLDNLKGLKLGELTDDQKFELAKSSPSTLESKKIDRIELLISLDKYSEAINLANEVVGDNVTPDGVNKAKALIEDAKFEKVTNIYDEKEKATELEKYIEGRDPGDPKTIVAESTLSEVKIELKELEENEKQLSEQYSKSNENVKKLYDNLISDFDRGVNSFNTKKYSSAISLFEGYIARYDSEFLSGSIESTDIVGEKLEGDLLDKYVTSYLLLIRSYSLDNKCEKIEDLDESPLSVIRALESSLASDLAKCWSARSGRESSEATLVYLTVIAEEYRYDSHALDNSLIFDDVARGTMAELILDLAELPSCSERESEFVCLKKSYLVKFSIDGVDPNFLYDFEDYDLKGDGKSALGKVCFWDDGGGEGFWDSFYGVFNGAGCCLGTNVC